MIRKISLICAFANNRVIGRGNDLPWDIPKDLEYFRETTRGKPVVMGRLTYESILTRIGKPLPKRPHYVVSGHHLGNLPEGVFGFQSLSTAIQTAKLDYPEQEIFIIGGAKVYTQAVPIVDRMYLTKIELDVEGGDAFFPEYNPSEWEEVHREDFLSEPIPFSFLTYDRK